MTKKPLVINKRGEDGTRIISLRIKEFLLNQIDELSEKTNRSRNEIILTPIAHGLDDVQVEE